MMQISPIRRTSLTLPSALNAARKEADGIFCQVIGKGLSTNVAPRPSSSRDGQDPAEAWSDAPVGLTAKRCPGDTSDYELSASIARPDRRMSVRVAPPRQASLRK